MAKTEEMRELVLLELDNLSRIPGGPFRYEIYAMRVELLRKKVLGESST